MKRQIRNQPIGTLTAKTGDHIEVGARIGQGASGVVYGALIKRGEKQEKVAVKFYLISKQSALFSTSMQHYWNDADEHAYDSERRALSDLQHPAIQEVLSWGVLDDAPPKFQAEEDFAVPAHGKVHYLVSRHIEGSPIDTWVKGLAQQAAGSNAPELHRLRNLVVACLTDIFEALDFLHSVRFHQHADIRADNILIHTPSDRPILVDFGFSQTFAKDILKSSPLTRVPPLRALGAPEILAARIDDITSKPRTPDLPRRISRKKLKDLLFPTLDLYKTGLLLKTLFDFGLGDLLAPLDRDVLRLIAGELSEWDSAARTTAKGVLAQLNKLADGYWSGASAQGTQLSPGQPVRQIALPGRSFLATPIVEQILETRSFRRLQRLKQLSLLEYVYPGATETRFSHCLAVYSTAVDLVSNLVRSPRFTRLFDNQSAGQLLVTALLHDMNHFPFLHYVQELDLAKAEDLNFYQLFVSGELTDEKDDTIEAVLTKAGLDSDAVVNVLTNKYEGLADPRDQVIKSIIDSGIDIDKLSYVPGDARSTGVPFGKGVDHGALLAGADIFRQPGPDEHWHLCFKPRALAAVESLLFARYWNFKQIYWHHTNRAFGAMVSHVLRTLAKGKALALREYVRKTLDSTEVQAMAHLDGLYREANNGRPSILSALLSRRTGLYKRLLSMRLPPSPGGHNADEKRRAEVLDGLRTLSDEGREALAKNLSEALVGMFPRIKERPTVLLDVPGRPLDADIGEVFVVDVALDGTETSRVESPFISTLKAEFLQLSRTIRFFIPPTTRDDIGKDTLLEARIDLEKKVAELLRPPKGSDSAAKATTVR